MKKKNQSLADKILDYIRRNEREQQVPAGYKSIVDWCKTLGCTRRRWGIILEALTLSKSIKQIKLRRVENGRVRVMNYYSIDEALIKKMSSKG
jgi:hypothetical protein